MINHEGKIINEALPAMPVEIFKQDGVLKQFFVDIREGRFTWVADKINDAHLISAIVNHCKADSYHFDEELRNLLRSI